MFDKLAGEIGNVDEHIQIVICKLPLSFFRFNLDHAERLLRRTDQWRTHDRPYFEIGNGIAGPKTLVHSGVAAEDCFALGNDSSCDCAADPRRRLDVVVSLLDRLRNEIPVRGFWSYYSELLGIAPSGAER